MITLGREGLGREDAGPPLRRQFLKAAVLGYLATGEAPVAAQLLKSVAPSLPPHPDDLEIRWLAAITYHRSARS